MEPIRSDGGKVLLDDESWCLLRLSATEPLVRCCGETRTPQALDILITAGRTLMLRS